MTSPEAYPQAVDKKTNNNSEGKTDVKQELLTEPKAIDLVKKIVESPNEFQSPEVFKSYLSDLKTIEEKYRAGLLPDNIKNIYENARKEALDQLQNELKNDPAFKEFLLTFDSGSNDNETPLLAFTEKEANILVSKILMNPEELKEQTNKVLYVEANEFRLNKAQRDYYNSVKTEIQNDPSWKEIMEKEKKAA